MNILFVHQNMPGQYREILRWLAGQGEHRIIFLTQRKEIQATPGVTIARYKTHHRSAKDAYALSRYFEDCMGAGYGAFLACRTMQDQGFRPDLILGHVGWGELTFVKQVWPDVPILGYWEYYFLSQGGSIGFDPEFPPSESAAQVSHARNAVNYLCLEAVDLGQSPTRWQMETYPEPFRAKSYVCHDGIRTDQLLPNAAASLRLARLDRDIGRNDEVFTYMARNMEPTRGFHVFMRRLPQILDARPQARVLIIGGNEVSYGQESGEAGGYRGQMERELGARVDWTRVHFLGRLPYADYVKVIQISRCHIYLTVPFVLSWSLLEAMSMQATMVASDTAPVREVITHGETGLLVDFLSPEALARQVIDVLARPGDYVGLGPAARARVVRDHDFLTQTRAVHVARMNSLVPRALAIRN